MNSLKNEIKFLFSGMGMPYEKVCMIVAIFVAVVMTACLRNNMCRDVPVAVIDMDHSRYSQEIIEMIDSTPYMDVSSVVYTPEEPRNFLAQDKNYAVIVLPKNLEQNRYGGTECSIGLFCDNSNTGLDGNIRSGLNAVVATENSKGASAGAGTISVNERLLFNPSSSYSNSTVLGFLIMFSAMFFTFATIGMVPRLKETGEWYKILKRGNPMDLAIKLLPYLGCLLTAMFVGMAILRIWGDMVFAGNIFEFILSQLLYLPALGLLSVLCGWSAANPGVASSRMIFLIPAGFVFGGATLPISFFPDWVMQISHIFPLTWEFKFIRDIVVRGSSISQMMDVFGGFLLYLGVIVLIFYVKFMRTSISWRREVIAKARRKAKWEEAT